MEAIQTSHERKTIAVDKDTAEKLADIAKKEGMTLFSLINEILEIAIYCREAQLGKFSEVVQRYQDLMIAKDIGMILVPLRTENLVHKLAFKTEEFKTLLGEWYNYGKWIANYAKVRFPGDELSIIEKVNKTIYWTRTEFKIKYLPEDQNPKEIELSIFGQELQTEFLECIVSTYEGIFNEFGFKTIKKTVSEGISLVKLKKIGS